MGAPGVCMDVCMCSVVLGQAHLIYFIIICTIRFHFICVSVGDRFVDGVCVCLLMPGVGYGTIYFINHIFFLRCRRVEHIYFIHLIIISIFVLNSPI